MPSAVSTAIKKDFGQILCRAERNHLTGKRHYNGPYITNAERKENLEKARKEREKK
jgi:hypothetical protein